MAGSENENSSPEFVLPDGLTAAEEGADESKAETEGEPEGELVDAKFTISPDETPKLDPRAEMARQIGELQKEVADQAVEVARRVSGAKSAKKEFDGLVEELRDLESRFERGDYGLCFDPAKSAGDPVAGDGIAAGNNGAPLPGQKFLPLKEDESWRSAPISELGLTGKLPESLEDAGIKTMGDLADYTAAGKLLTDITGIGQGKAEKIEKACEEFWGRQKLLQPAVGDSVKADADSDTATAELNDIPVELTQAASDAGAEDDEETKAYAAGCEAAIEGHGTESNPHKRGTRLWLMFDRGWQETNAS